jgi:hypothetical protein
MAALMQYQWWALRQELSSSCSSLWSSLNRAILITSYSRAAAELARLGYTEEAKHCMVELSNLKK